MRPPFSFVAILSCVLASSAMAGTSQLPIINGDPIDSADFESAAALIVHADVQDLGELTNVGCTATLIAPDAVLTAGHCVDPFSITFGFFELNSIEYCVSFKADLSEMTDPAAQGNPDIPDDAVCSSGFVAHPDFSLDNLSGAVDGLLEVDDIALVFLEEPITDRDHAYLPDADEAEAIEVDLEVDIVGYGQRDAAPQDPFGTPPDPLRYHAHTFINEVGATEMQIGGDSSTGRKCHGDSGGPTYADIGDTPSLTRRVIGVTSHAYSAAEDCNIGGADTMVHPYLDWIDEALRDACDEGLRTACDEPGILRPPEPASGDDDGDDTACQNCSGTVAGPGHGAGLFLLLVLVIGRRRGGR